MEGHSLSDQGMMFCYTQHCARSMVIRVGLVKFAAACFCHPMSGLIVDRFAVSPDAFLSNLVLRAAFSHAASMAVEMDPDATLMLRTRQGDMDAFASLVDKYKGPVINLAARMLQDPVEAEDMAQAVFVQVYKSADRYKPSSKFSTWLFTIARNLCLNEIRRRGRHRAQSLDALSSPSDENPSGIQLADATAAPPPDSLLEGELSAKIEQALQELPENQRTAILLCRRDDQSYDDIAEILGVSVSAVKSLIHRGRETLKARLKPYLKTGDWS